MDRLFTVQEAARYLRYSVHSLQRWRRVGDGPAYIKPHGRKVLYRKSDLNAWINKCDAMSQTDGLSGDRRKRAGRPRLTAEALDRLDKELGADD